MFKRIGLRTKLILLFLAVGIIPTLVVSYLSYRSAREGIHEEVFTSQATYARLKKTAFEDYFNRLEKSIRVIAAAQDVYDNMNFLLASGGDMTSEEWQTRRLVLDSFASKAAEEYGFTQLFITDPSGKTIFDSGGDVEGFLFTRRQELQHALLGETVWSPLFFNDRINEHILVVSSPVFSEGSSGEVVGTINIVVTSEVIGSFVHQDLEQLGASANAYLIDQDGLLLTNTTYGLFTEDAAMREYLTTAAVEMLYNPIIQNELDFSVQAEYVDYQGNAVLGNLQVVQLGDMAVGMVVELKSTEAFASISALAYKTVIATVAAAIVVALLGYLLANAINRPLQKVAVLASQIAGGDFTVETDLDGEDELGRLGGSFNAMSRNLRQLISQAVETATWVNSGSESVSSAADEMSSSLEQVSASTGEFAENAERLNNGSQQMAEANRRIVERAEEGNSSIRETVEQISTINSRVSKLEEIITQVERRSQEIGKISQVITGIAEQTNLLALNAAIEAARAGDHGRGFAVVADEVRKLAEQSATAASGIGELIRDTQRESSSAVDNMARSVQDVERGVAMVTRTGAIFSEIMQDVAEIGRQVEVTAGAAAELSAGSEQMAAAIEEQSSTMEEVAASAEELRASAEKLFQELTQFKYEKASVQSEDGLS